MIFDCPYCGTELENQDPILESIGGHTMCPECFEMMRIDPVKKEEKSTIIYNNYIKIYNIPEAAYEYVVNGKSAIEWIIERYQIKIDKDSQIKNDPNDWAKEHNQPRYILDLLLSIITVSVATVKIVKSLPELEFSTIT